MYFCKIHSICPVNVCTNFEINRYKIDKCFIWTHVTQKGYVVRYPTVVFMFMVTLILTFDLCYICCHTKYARSTGISTRSFIRIRQVLMGDIPRTHTQTHTHTEGKINILANTFGARLIIDIRNSFHYVVSFDVRKVKRQQIPQCACPIGSFVCPN